MNHLRDLIDSLNQSVNAPRESGLTDDELDAMAGWCQSVGERAVAFFVGDISVITELQVVRELVRLPYPTCWFESEVRPPSRPDILMHAGLLLHTFENGTCAGQVWTKLRGEWLFIGQVYCDDEPQKWRAAGASRDSCEVIALQCKAAQCFLSALHCSNVRRQEHIPSAKLQKARAKRGRAPLFSYWTLQLDGKSERGESQGGTHASPRVHLRRGHPRQYAPGKWTWVQACAVGNRAAGMVHKDYKAGPAMVAAAQ